MFVCLYVGARGSPCFVSCVCVCVWGGGGGGSLVPRPMFSQQRMDYNNNRTSDM